MPNQGKIKNPETQHILKEQNMLTTAERQIQSLIDKVNEALNALLVEEMQLKSNEISAEYIISEVPEIDKKPTNAEIIASYDSQTINEQVLDISTLFCAKNQMEEDDE